VNAIPALIIAVAVAATSAAAQSVAAATPGSSKLIEQNIYRELFGGITQSSEQRAKAQAIIAMAEKKMSPVEPPWHSCDERQKLLDIQAQRDSLLLSMMNTAHDSAMFSKHAATFLMGPCKVH
jgi:hypothetical protein